MYGLSKRQQNALAQALWVVPATDNAVFACRLKWLLLRAFVVYQRREQLSADRLRQYRCDLQQRLQEYILLQSEQMWGWKWRKNYTYIPYYWFAFLAAISNSPKAVECDKIETASLLLESNTYASKWQNILSCYYRIWAVIVDSFIRISTKNLYITNFKYALGCISFFPIIVGNETINIRGYCIEYHDLYHLEVSQLERIQMGKYWVSGIHGINSPVFHNAPIVQEYDGFLDEARIAFHEVLTRPTAFSKLKAFCWIFLLALHGINPFAVLMRHIRSMRDKQEELMLLNC